ncbi:tRNA pseudouridine(38-40) synthase TruA [Corynebacterium uberis]|uniref:tRNA pseudouridine(38-40) synthase TruA n=1 Tax=Corynebacterium TaxID=1716 RepID=UPI001D0B3C5E|nr:MULTISPECIES: tRNA pseudouridine(38-40) synthase TruA [Corynebacterium]MCZ9309370.1 tRNA pseudouridine(38-40) synthase TruA [Corynebacterium sp. c6VSa_13]UDL72919.1 tRNA pseudouridine(38-40) synthase TruA [Corynebacterium uberis]UDL76204.1 tRNA pseudouridine(38-40) synthase TruA [Corynebacterium uberis]UDL78416.1 tRNA pseudouridine(38-40) synthase TruA [Corynebacterium uberis]UDL80699.1 tRNA pseudouridine(38-40) synthase TruA [Corynebacterium uberis]
MALPEAMVRLRLDLAYDGTDFHGWARQKDPQLRTVQAVVEDAFSLVLRVPVALTVAGRTDAGVHASGQVAHCDIPASALEQRSIDGDPARLVRRMSRLLPEDIRLSACTLAPEGFDARFSALRRHYRYRVTTASAGVLPTRVRETAWWAKPVDVQAMQRCADELIGLHDFAAFCKARPHATTVRDVQSFVWRDISTPTQPQLYEAQVSADAFCWSMVRSLVGCCLVVGEGRREAGFAAEVLELRSRSSRVPVAPACGLDLVGVEYPDAAELAARAEVTRARRSLS